MNKNDAPSLITTLLNGYQWVALLLLAIVGRAAKELYGVVITKQFETLKAEMKEERDEQRKQIESLRTQNEVLLQVVSDMRVEIAKLSTKLERDK